MGRKRLRGMQPVLFHVAHVVEQIDRGADQAERDEGQGGALDDGRLEQSARGQRGGKHKQVLDPLAGSHGADRGRHSAAANSNLRGFRHQDATLSSHWESAVTASKRTLPWSACGSTGELRASALREPFHEATSELRASALREQLQISALTGSRWLQRFLVASSWDVALIPRATPALPRRPHLRLVHHPFPPTARPSPSSASSMDRFSISRCRVQPLSQRRSISRTM